MKKGISWGSLLLIFSLNPARTLYECRLGRGVLFYLFAMMVFCVSPDQAQEQKNAAPSNYQLKIPVDLVVVPVTVKDSEGNLVTGLAKPDFRLEEEDQGEQPITYFSIDPLPLSVAILVDRTLDDRTQELFQRHLPAILGALSPFDEAALFDFMEVRRKIQDFTMDREIVVKGGARISFLPGYTMPFLNWPTVVPGGRDPNSGKTTLDGKPRESMDIKIGAYGPPLPNLNSAIYSVAYDLHRRESWRRKVIFAVSSGRSAFADRRTVPEALQCISKEGVIVCGISGGGTLLLRHMDPLQKYASATGGEVYLPFRDRAFPETFQKLLVEVRNQYILGFKPHEPGKPGEFRKIKVQVLNPRCQGGEIHYRRGYYSRPESSDAKEK